MPLRKLDAPRSVTMMALAKSVRYFTTHKRVIVANIVAVTGVHETTASRLLHALHKERVIHISDWLVDSIGRDQTPVYTFGEAPDVPRRKLTGAERTRAYRDRKRASMIEQQLKGTTHVD